MTLLQLPTRLRDLAARCARVLLENPALSIRGSSATPRGSRECRAPDAPAALRAKVESTQASHHGHAGSPGIPRAMVLTAYFALSPVTGLSCHRRQWSYLHQLDASVGASGPHDFAVRKIALSSGAHLTSTASRPAFVTIASRPLWDGTARDRQVICARREQKYFCKEGWTHPPNHQTSSRTFASSARTIARLALKVRLRHSRPYFEAFAILCSRWPVP
jgi:hypothetical protein